MTLYCLAFGQFTAFPADVCVAVGVFTTSGMNPPEAGQAFPASIRDKYATCVTFCVATAHKLVQLRCISPLTNTISLVMESVDIECNADLVPPFEVRDELTHRLQHYVIFWRRLIFGIGRSIVEAHAKGSVPM